MQAKQDSHRAVCSIRFRPCLALPCAALTELISSYLCRVSGGQWQCRECGRLDSKGHMVEHVETSHLQGVEYFCSYCNVKKYSRATLRRHINYAHKNSTI